jgi:hypothetical protein
MPMWLKFDIFDVALQHHNHYDDPSEPSTTEVHFTLYPRRGYSIELETGERLCNPKDYDYVAELDEPMAISLVVLKSGTPRLSGYSSSLFYSPEQKLVSAPTISVESYVQGFVVLEPMEFDFLAKNIRHHQIPTSVTIQHDYHSGSDKNKIVYGFIGESFNGKITWLTKNEENHRVHIKSIVFEYAVKSTKVPLASDDEEKNVAKKDDVPKLLKDILMKLEGFEARKREFDNYLKALPSIIVFCAICAAIVGGIVYGIGRFFK